MSDKIYTHAPEETEAVGEALAKELLSAGCRHACVALRGEMGVGKTAFVRGFGRALGCRAVRSPTYTVVNEYAGTPFPVFHFDLYRVADEDELYAIGFEDYLKRDGYMICEWSENATASLPTDRITITIERMQDEIDGRCITREGQYEDLGH